MFRDLSLQRLTGIEMPKVTQTNRSPQAPAKTDLPAPEVRRFKQGSSGAQALHQYEPARTTLAARLMKAVSPVEVNPMGALMSAVAQATGSTPVKTKPLVSVNQDCVPMKMAQAAVDAAQHPMVAAWRERASACSDFCSATGAMVQSAGDSLQWLGPLSTTVGCVGKIADFTGAFNTMMDGDASLTEKALTLASLQDGSGLAGCASTIVGANRERDPRKFSGGMLQMALTGGIYVAMGTGQFGPAAALTALKSQVSSQTSYATKAVDPEMPLAQVSPEVLARFRASFNSKTIPDW